MATNKHLVVIRGHGVRSVKIDDFDLFMYAGKQWRANTDPADLVDTPKGYAYPSEYLGDP